MQRLSRRCVPSWLVAGDGTFLLPHPTGSCTALALQQRAGAGSTAMLEKPFPHPLKVRAGLLPGRGSSLPSLHSVLLFFLLGTTRCLIISTAQLLQKNVLGPCPAQSPPSLKNFHFKKSQMILILHLGDHGTFPEDLFLATPFPFLTQLSCSSTSELKVWGKASSSGAATFADRLGVLVASLPSGASSPAGAGR